MRVYASAEMTLTDTNDGISVTGIDRYYMASSSSSGITVDNQGWKPDPQETNPISRYHWSYEVVNYSDGAKIPSKPAVIGVYGKDGKEGIDAVTVSLSSEAHTFAGTDNKAIASSITIDVYAFKGSQRIPTSISTVTGGVAGQLTHSELGRGTTNNKLVINATSALGKGDGTLSIPIVADGRTFNKVFSWSVAFKGNPGSNGKDGTSIISVDVEYAKNTSKTTAPTSGWTTSAPQWESGSYIWQRIKTTYSVGNPTYSEPHAIETDVANSLTDYVASRGQNLVTNGTGMLKDSTNFPGFTFDGSQAYASDGSFLYRGGANTLTISESIPIDPNLSYRLNYYIKGDVEGQTAPVRAYGFIVCRDIDGHGISPGHTMYLSGTTTKLAQDLNIGDTKIYLEDSSGWGRSELTHQRSIIIWGYKNSYGYEYPAETYSRDWVQDLWANASSIDKVNHVITLKTPWTLGNFPKGREVSNGNNGGGYKYIAGSNFPIEQQWENYNGTIGGIDTTGTNMYDKFHPGTASIKVGWLLNRYANISTWIANVSFMLDNASAGDLNETKEQVKKTVKTITEEYYQSTSATSQTGGGWTETAPTWKEGKFIFIRSKITYVDGTSDYTPIVNITGAKGDTGKQGPDGPEGPRGIPGEKGDDGQSQWVHVRYSVNSNGSGMTPSPSSTTKYVGIAVTNSATAPPYTGFTWSKYIGENGAPGEPGLPGKNGTDGTTTYTWVRYADTPTSGMENFPAGKKYIGLAFNKTTQTESNNYSDYQWSLMPQNIEIGGRNLLKNTGPTDGTSGWSGASIYELNGENVLRVTGTMSESANTPLEPNQYYTTSMEIYPTVDVPINNGTPLHTYYRDSSSNNGGVASRTTLDEGSVAKANEWTKITEVVRTNQDVTTYKFHVYYPTYINSTSPAYVRNIKFEKGNVATDWTPAPEDVEAAYTAVAEAKAEAKRVLAEAYADDKVDAEEEARIKDANAKLAAAKQHAENISKVQDIGNGDKKFINVGSLGAKPSSATGYLVIKTPLTSPYMTKMKISGYNYRVSKTNIDISVSFYAYSNNAFHNYSFISSGNYPYEKVQLARDSSGKTVVIIGNQSDTYSYPKISIDEVLVTQGTPPESFKNGFSAEIVTDISMYTNVVNIPGEDTQLSISAAQTAANNAATAASNAQGTATAASNSASTANNLLGDIASDSKLTATEKKAAKKEWDIIVGEKPKIDSSADTYGIITQKTAYNTAYHTLNNYLSGLLANLNTTSNIVGATFRANFTAYYNARQDLLNKIADGAKSLVDEIEIGGRNLFSVNEYVSLRNSNMYSVGSSGALVVNGVDGSGGYDAMKMVDLKANTEYIFTFNIPINDRFSIYDTDGVAISIPGTWNSDSTQLTFKMGNVDGYIGGKFYPIEQKYPAEIYLMAEKGNTATDWTPAPEDVQAKINDKASAEDLINAENGLSTSIGDLSNTVDGKVDRSMYEEFLEHNADIQQQLSASTANAQEDISKALARTATVEQKLGEGAADWIFTHTQIRMSDEGITLGEEGSGSYLQITNDQISFYNGSADPVAFINGGMLNINHAIFVESIQISEFMFSSEAPGHLTLRYVGN